MIKRFNVRVYGIIVRNEHVLIAHERRGDWSFTKFPGGGLEKGEGIVEGLKREMREELNLKIKSMSHFYTTEAFVQSAFDPEDQIISIYYRIEFDDDELSNMAMALDHPGESINFEWKAISKVKESDLTFPIDKEVLGLLKGEHVDILSKP